MPAEAAPRAALAPAAALFHGLSDSARLALLRRLADGEARVVDLVAELGLAQSTVSADLLVTADTLLAATGNAVALCAGFGGTRPELQPTTTAETTQDEESPR